MNQYSIVEIFSERWYSLEDYEGEIWKDVVGFEGYYLVSNYGRIKSVSRIHTHTNGIIPSKIKRYGDNGNGYLIVHLSKNSISHTKYVHRLVAIAFLPNPLNLPEVNHKDEDKSNNRLENLEWCTGLYNTNYGTGKYRGQEKRKKNGWLKSIDMYDLKGNLLKHYRCAYDVEKDGLSRRSVYNVCYKKNKSYKGCVFRFSGDPFSYSCTRHNTKGKKKNVIKTDINGNIICVYTSIKEAEKKNNLNRNYLYTTTYASTKKAFVNGCYYEII